MSELKKIVMGRNENEVVLTVGIVDENRQALAYNMLYYMAEHGATIKANGKEMPLEKDRLWVVTEEADDGRRYNKPHLDPEWFGANGHNFKKEREFTVFAQDGSNRSEYVRIEHAPMTGSIEKANEMENFMLTSIDPSISIFCMHEGKMKPIIVNGESPAYEGIVDADGRLQVRQSEYDWATSAGKKFTYELAVDKKYELLMEDSKKEHGLSYDEHYKSDKTIGVSNNDRTVYRIRALKDFGAVKAGDLGGYVESENNLSHDGYCWIYGDNIVCNDAVVKDNALILEYPHGSVRIGGAAEISGSAVVFGKAMIKDNAKVTDNARVGWDWDGITSKNGKWKNADTTRIEENAEVSGYAQVLGEVIVCGNAKIRENVRVEGRWPSVPDDKYKAYYIGCVRDNAIIEGNANVLNAYVESNAHVFEDAKISGHPVMGGHADIRGNAEIGGHAKITHNVTVHGDAKIGGNAVIKDKVTIGHDADIQQTGDYFGLKVLGKSSYAVRNQDDGIIVVHKGKVYNGIEEFKNNAANLDEKDKAAIEMMESHFESQLIQGFEEGLSSINTEDAKMEL